MESTVPKTVPAPVLAQNPIHFGEWIIGRSKSYLGRPYYYNTISRKAVWNLSDAELMYVTKHNHHIIPEIPEPKGPPTDHVTKITGPPDVHCMKQITNVPPTFILQKQMPPPVDYPNFSPIPSQQPSFSNSLGLPSNPALAMTNIHFTGIPIESTRLSISNRFKSIDATTSNLETRQQNLIDKSTVTTHSTHRSNFVSQQSRSFKPNFKKGYAYKNYKNKKCKRNNNLKDLRELINARRVLNESASGKKSFTEPEQDVNKISKEIQHQNKDMPVGAKEIKIPVETIDTGKPPKENVLTKLNLKRIKSLLGCGDNDVWFVVPDTNVYIDDCDFLKVFLESDDNCRLFVSRQIRSELTENTSEASAQAALQFINQSLRTVSGEIFSTLKESNIGSDDHILNSCLQLIKHKFHVLLITNNMVLINKAKDHTITTFSTESLKECVLSSSNEININTSKDKCFESQATPNTSIGENPYQERSILPIREESQTNDNKNSESLIQEVPQRNQQCSHLTSNSNFPNKKRKWWSRRQKSKHLNSGTSSNLNTRNTDKSNEASMTATINNIEINFMQLINNNNDQSLFDSSNSTQIEFRSPENARPNRDSSAKTQLKSHDVTKTQFGSLGSTQTPFELLDMDNTVSLFGSIDIRDQIQFESLANTETEYTLINNAQTQFETPTKPTQEADSDSDSFYLIKRLNRTQIGNSLQPKTVDESSTNSSDVISNTISYASSTKCNNVRSSVVSDFEGNIDKYLFDVSDVELEQRLKTGSEEWLSRFLQIMDEVLTQILHQNPLEGNPYPPPWTIHEAVECLKRKFNASKSLTTAATRLSFAIFSSSDRFGNLSREFSANRFMMLFSHGWSFVNALQTILPESEDISIAKDSLMKLLSDIKGHNSHIIESFVQNCAEDSGDVSACCVNLSMENNDNNGNVNENLQINHDYIQVPSPILQTQRKTIQETQKQLQEPVEDKLPTHKDTALYNKRNEERRINTNNNDSLKKTFTDDSSPMTSDISPKSVGPKVIRLFKKCAEYEKRVSEARGQLDMNMLSNSEDYSSTCNYYQDYFSEHYYEDGGYDTEGSIRQVAAELVNTFLSEIKETFLQVHSYCVETCLELSANEQLSYNRKVELREQTEDIQAFMNSLLITLKSCKEQENESDDIQQPKFIDFEVVDPTPPSGPTYSDVLEKCSVQANILLDVLNGILKEIPAVH